MYKNILTLNDLKEGYCDKQQYLSIDSTVYFHKNHFNESTINKNDYYHVIDKTNYTKIEYYLFNEKLHNLHGPALVLSTKWFGFVYVQKYYFILNEKFELNNFIFHPMVVNLQEKLYGKAELEFHLKYYTELSKIKDLNTIDY